jgi:lysozyme
MKPSNQLIEFLSKAEGRVNKVYKDSGGAPTIGVGHLLTNSERKSGKIKIGTELIKYADGLTDSQVDQLLMQDILPAANAVDELVHVNLRQWQYDALVSFTFNVGVNAFAHSSLLKVLNQFKYDGVPGQLRKWVYDNGKKVKGLVNRRENEIKLWNNEV